MKKLISIICAVLLLFSLSAVAYAEETTGKLSETTSVSVIETTTEVSTEASTTETSTKITTAPLITEAPTTKVDAGRYLVKITLISDTLETIDENTGAQHRAFKFDVEVTNKTKQNIDMKDINIEVKAVDSNTYEPIPVIHSGWKMGETKVINAGDENVSAVWTCKIPSNHKVILKVSVNGEPFQVITEKNKPASFNMKAPTEISTSAPVTEKPSVSESQISTTTTKLPDSPHTEAPIEDEIPNTGSTKAIYAAAALAIAGAVALLVIKKKSDD